MFFLSFEFFYKAPYEGGITKNTDMYVPADCLNYGYFQCSYNFSFLRLRKRKDEYSCFKNNQYLEMM